VDDTTIWEECATDFHDSNLQTASNQAAEWSKKNLMKVNSDKSKTMEIAFSRKNPVIPPIRLDGEILESVQTFKLLGVLISSDLSWGAHIDYLHRKCSSRVYLLLLLKRAGIPTADILQIYTSMIRSVLEYACQVWHTSLTCGQSDKLEAIQRRALRILYPDHPYAEALNLSGLPRLSERREELSKAFFTDILDPGHQLHYLLPPPRANLYGLRHFKKHPDIKTRNKRFSHTLIPHRLRNWQPN